MKSTNSAPIRGSYSPLRRPRSPQHTNRTKNSKGPQRRARAATAEKRAKMTGATVSSRTSGGLKSYSQAESLAQSQKHRVNAPIVWRDALPDKRVCALTVEGAPEGAVVHMTVLRRKFSEPKVVFRVADGWARRLCVNGTHRPIKGTHKHTIAPGGLEDAYQPDDIPHVPLTRRAPIGIHREIMEAFLAECNIELGPGYKWTDPYSEEELE